MFICFSLVSALLMASITDTCGTASMLPKESGGVVDHKLIVYGTTNLRVVDLSTLPLHTAAHPQCEYSVSKQNMAKIRSYPQHMYILSLSMVRRCCYVYFAR